MTHEQTTPGRLTTIEDITKFMMAGNATLTLVSERTCARYTYRVRRSTDGRVSFVALMYGSDNESEFKYLGVIREGVYKHGRKSKVTESSAPAMAFNWFHARVQAKRMPADMQVWHEGRCCRCNRKLTVPESIANGVGPECAEIMAGARAA